MAIPKQLFTENIECVFLACAFPDIQEALAALEEAPAEVEALVIQPNYKSSLKSAKEAMSLYEKLRPGKHFPILFTPQHRFGDQLFQYGSYLLDMRDQTDVAVVERNVEEGRWFNWEEELHAENFLIVKRPITELEIQPPVEVATNLLPGPSQGEPIGTVGIPSPKVMGLIYCHLLRGL